MPLGNTDFTRQHTAAEKKAERQKVKDDGRHLGSEATATAMKSRCCLLRWRGLPG